jgi:predicted glycosyltransferase
MPLEVLAMVSGPEPQRTLFEASLKAQLAKMSGTRVLVRGLPDATAPTLPKDLSLSLGQLNTFNHLPGESLARLLRQANLVVARSGYTTVMELASLGVKTVVLVPTPGQSEQEYLADHLESSHTALRMNQNKMDLSQARQALINYSGFTSWAEGNDFRETSENSEPRSRSRSGSGSGSRFRLQSFIQNHKWLTAPIPKPE